MTALDAPAISTAEFIRGLFVEGLGRPPVLEIRGIKPDKRPPAERKANPLKKSDVRFFLIAAGDPLPEFTVDRNWYVTVSAHKRPHRGSTTAKTARAAVALWADIDFDHDGRPREKIVADATRRLEASGLPTPSITVFTGHGIHYYWMLKEPYIFASIKHAATFVDALKRLRGVLGGDPQVCDIARVMRIPGTLNVKDAVAVSCEVLSRSGSRIPFAGMQNSLKLGHLLRHYLRTSGREHALTKALTGWAGLNLHQNDAARFLAAVFDVEEYEAIPQVARTLLERALERDPSKEDERVEWHTSLADALKAAPWQVEFVEKELEPLKKTMRKERRETTMAQIQVVAPPTADRVEAQLADDEVAVWTSKGIQLERRPVDRKGNPTTPHKRHVIKGFVRPVAVLEVDGEEFIEFDMGAKKEITTMSEMIGRLRRRGAVVSDHDASNCLSAISHETAKIHRKAHATYGVYEASDGALELCEDPLPVKGEQIKVWEAVRGNLHIQATAESLQAYADLLSYWHLYEALPIMGLSLCAPFTPILRSRGWMVPHLLAVSDESDLGKSMLQAAFSERLFGVPTLTARAMNSTFRLADHLNSICLPIVFDEADRLRPELFDTLKTSAERWLIDKRGNAGRGEEYYWSRACALFNANALGHFRPGEHKRILIPRFDDQAKAARRPKSRELGKLHAQLAPIGFDLVRLFVDELRTVEHLVDTISGFEETLEPLRTPWSSVTRLKAWASVYFGLQLFSHACKQHGVAWRAPAIEQFYEAAIRPVEDSTDEIRRTKADEFQSWFLRWRQLKATVLGEPNEFFMHVSSADLPEGYWVTKLTTDEFKTQAEPGWEFGSLNDAARLLQQFSGLDAQKVLAPDGKSAKVVPWREASFGEPGSRNRKAAFLPVPQEPAERDVTALLPNITPKSDETVTATNDTLAPSDKPSSYQVTAKMPLYSPHVEVEGPLADEALSLELKGRPEAAPPLRRGSL